MTKLTGEWFVAALIRAIKTFAQTILGMVVVGATFTSVNWSTVLEVAVVAAGLSLLTSLGGLPEVGSDGQLVVNTSDPNKDLYKLELNSPLDTLATKSSVTLKVVK